MAGQDAIRIGSTVAGAALGSFLGPVGTAAGAALGAGASTAGTGGSLKRSLTNAGLAGVGGYGAGTLAAPFLAAPGAAATALPAIPSAASPLSTSIAGGVTPLVNAPTGATGLNAAFSTAAGSPLVGSYALPTASSAATGSAATGAGVLDKLTTGLGQLGTSVAPKDPLQALMMAGMLSSMTNPPPVPYQGVQASVTPGRGLPAGNFDPAQYMVRRER